MAIAANFIGSRLAQCSLEFRVFQCPACPARRRMDGPSYLYSGQVWCLECHGDVRYREWKRLDLVEEQCGSIQEMRSTHKLLDEVVLAGVGVADVRTPPGRGRIVKQCSTGDPWFLWRIIFKA